MPIGLLVNCIAVVGGGLAGAAAGRRIPAKLAANLTIILGICSMCIGIENIAKVHALPPVIMAVLFGYVVGDLLKLEDRIAMGFQAVFRKVPITGTNFNMDQFVMVVVLFCASGFGIFGVLAEGMSGNSSILMSKSFMDFFTAMIFAGTLGYAVTIVAVPQFVIGIILFFASRFMAGFMSEALLLNFVACGGVLTFAAGFRIAELKKIPIGNLIPALVLVIPFSWLWSTLPF